MMTTIRRTEAGETLLEIVIALVIIGIVFSAFFAAYSTAAVSSTTHRNVTNEDRILRDYAEGTKAAAKRDCATNDASSPGATYSPTFAALPQGYSVITTASPTGTTCPPLDNPQEVTFTVRGPSGSTGSLAIEVRTP